MTFQKAISKTGIAVRFDKGQRIYRDKFGVWTIKGSEIVTLPSKEGEGYTDWEPIETSFCPDEQILALLKDTKQQIDKLIKLTETYI